ncbi:MAG: dTDP-glucose 4,6-dehydratase [Deltaproteobacteria bacterium]|nr:dTDP-glucose 4,6-dehydratase [Deltaproteobacteria bacterium]
MKKILVTGGAGFIGSELVRRLVADGYTVLNFDKLTYAANLKALEGVKKNQRYQFIKGDICDGDAVTDAFRSFQPNVIMHLAAESHVDRSIAGADEFIQTNIMGTFTLLKAARSFWEENGKTSLFRFIHVSTDEVYGALQKDDRPFTEQTPYAPNSPYSSSKAASDHLARAWYETYSLPVMITHCSNNYGPWQNTEKLIPLMISHALAGKKLPVYGKGENIRDWIYVEDHALGLIDVMNKGMPGEVYNMGGENEVKNIHLVEKICDMLDERVPKKDGSSYKTQISYVTDRLGHDFRYAIDNTKIHHTLGWKPEKTLEEGLSHTITWFLENRA